MKWSEKDFRARVKAHAELQGMTVTELLKRAQVTEDYFRHPPEVGRNIGGILKIADVLKVNPAELMGLDVSSDERRSMTMIAHVMAQRQRAGHREDRRCGDGSLEAIRGGAYGKTSDEGGKGGKATAIGVTTSSPSCQQLPSQRISVNSRRPATAAR
jgi:hypothetical protein